MKWRLKYTGYSDRLDMLIMYSTIVMLEEIKDNAHQVCKFWSHMMSFPNGHTWDMWKVSVRHHTPPSDKNRHSSHLTSYISLFLSVLSIYLSICVLSPLSVLLAIYHSTVQRTDISKKSVQWNLFRCILLLNK